MKATIRSILVIIAFIIGWAMWKEGYERYFRKPGAAPKKDSHTSGPDTPENVRKRQEDLLAEQDTPRTYGAFSPS